VGLGTVKGSATQEPETWRRSCYHFVARISSKLYIYIYNLSPYLKNTTQLFSDSYSCLGKLSLFIVKRLRGIVRTTPIFEEWFLQLACQRFYKSRKSIVSVSFLFSNRTYRTALRQTINKNAALVSLKVDIAHLEHFYIWYTYISVYLTKCRGTITYVPVVKSGGSNEQISLK
jgi:hypothetical protein